MSIDSDNPRRRRNEPDGGSAFEPLPAWNASALEPDPPSPSTSVPPYVERRQWHIAAQTETLLKALGAVLVVSALVVAAVLAFKGSGDGADPTPTAGAAVVMAPSNAPVVTIATPAGDLAYDERNAEITICIDAGHGGNDMGYQRTATSNVPAMDESYFNLAIAKELEQRLLQRGFVVIMTRTDDNDVNVNDVDSNNDGQTGGRDSQTDASIVPGDLDEIQSRIDVCNDGRADLLVSIHVDGSSDPAVRGSRVWYSETRPFTQENQALAGLMYEKLEEQMRQVGYPWIGRGISNENDVSNASQHAQLQQLLIGPEREELKEPSAMPGVVVEVLTITSDADATFLSSEQGLSTIATALDQAILQFVETSLRSDG